MMQSVKTEDLFVEAHDLDEKLARVEGVVTVFMKSPESGEVDLMEIVPDAEGSARITLRREGRWGYLSIADYRNGFEFHSDDEEEVSDVVEICTSLCAGMAEIVFTARRRHPILLEVNTGRQVLRAEISPVDLWGKRGRVVPARGDRHRWVREVRDEPHRPSPWIG